MGTQMVVFGFVNFVLIKISEDFVTERVGPVISL